GSMANFSLFERAEVANFKIRTELPIYFEGENDKWLTTLLSGCSIQSMSLVFDKSTLKNLHLVPALLRSVYCRSVEFILETFAMWHNMVEEFNSHVLVAQFAEAGVTSVTLTRLLHGRFQKGTAKKETLPKRDVFEFDILRLFIESGITKIIINENTFGGRTSSIGEAQFGIFLQNIAATSAPLYIKLRQYKTSLKGGRRMQSGFRVNVDNNAGSCEEITICSS
ncbi:hypothetical protein PFISCL1PPCAC_21897, partial [Pristionchus fissidentatus]